MWQQATAHMRAISAQPSVSAIAIDSDGDRVFSAGADLFELADLAGRRSDLAHMLNGIEEFNRSVEAAPQPVVAVMTGSALGAGLEIAAAADIRVASTQSVFGVPAARLGAVITRTDVWRLVRAFGYPVASDLLLTGRILNAEEAHRLGFLSSVSAPREVRKAAAEICRRISELSNEAVTAMKRHLLAVAGPPDWTDTAYAPSIDALTSDDTKARIHSRLAPK
jgi:enoyl-CoA hydratase